MPLDPNIILGVKPAQIPQQDPFDQYTKTMTLKHLMGQNELQGLQTQQARESLTDDTAVRDAYKAAGGDSERLRQILQSGGQYKQLQTLDKLLLEKREKESTIDKNTAQTGKAKVEALDKSLQIHRDQLTNVNDAGSAVRWLAAGYADPVIGPILQRAGTLEQVTARIPQEPTAFADWKNKNALGIEKFIELNKPHVMTQELGGTSQIVSTPGLGGAPTILSSTAKSQSPDSIASNTTQRRGQDMTDKRQREQNTVAAATAGLKQMELTHALNKDVNQAQGVIASFDTALRSLDTLEKHPGFGAAVGASILPGQRFVPGTDAAGFDAHLETLKAQTFLPMIEKMRGMGALSNAEGDKLTAAVGALKLSMPEKEFRASMAQVKADLESARKRAQGNLANMPKPAANGKIGGVLTQNPDGSFNYGM